MPIRGAFSNVASPESVGFAYLSSSPGHFTRGSKPAIIANAGEILSRSGKCFRHESIETVKRNLDEVENVYPRKKVAQLNLLQATRLIADTLGTSFSVRIN